MLASLDRRPHLPSRVDQLGTAAFRLSGGGGSTGVLAHLREGWWRETYGSITGGKSRNPWVDRPGLRTRHISLHRGSSVWRAVSRSSVGDFAFAIWDPGRRALFAARDPFGVKPFYYTVAGSKGRDLFSNDVEPLVGHVDRSAPRFRGDDRLPLDVVSAPTPDFFSRDRRLQPGHFLIVRRAAPLNTGISFLPQERAGFSARRIASRNFDCSAQARRSRSPRKRRTDPAHLSGGLDSTSIVLLADEIYAADGAHRRAPLTTASAVFPGLPCDESSIIVATRARVRFPSETWLACDAKWEISGTPASRGRAVRRRSRGGRQAISTSPGGWARRSS